MRGVRCPMLAPIPATRIRCFAPGDKRFGSNPIRHGFAAAQGQAELDLPSERTEIRLTSIAVAARGAVVAVAILFGLGTAIMASELPVNCDSRCTGTVLLASSGRKGKGPKMISGNARFLNTI